MFIKKLLFSFLKKLKNDEILLYAQGLTFTTLLTLIPILGLLISLAHIFIPQKALIDQFIIQIAKYLTSEATQKVINAILTIIKKLESFPLGKFSIITYFFMSLALLFQLEEVLNKIFESSKKRTFIQRLTFFWLCMTLTPGLFFLPFSFYSYLGKFSTIFIFSLVTLFFFLMYVYFPAKDVPKKEALIGAIFSTILWICSSYFYSIYIKYAINYSKIYGSLAAIPLFLIWIFINWTIFLMGAELVVFLEQKNWKRTPLNLTHPWLKVYVMYLIGKNFLKGIVLDLFSLAEKLNLSPILLESTLQELETAGLIVLKEENIYLAKPLEKIKIAELVDLSIASELNEPPELEEFFQKMQNLLNNFFKITLKDLVN